MVLLLSTGVISCKKTNSLSVTNSPTAVTFFDANQPATQVFNYNTTDLPKAFTLNDGTIITVPAGAFTVGGVVATGTAILEVIPFSKKGNMMLGGLNTTADGQILESQGSFKLAQRINGVAVDEDLAVGKFLKFEVPAGVAVTTQLFKGVVADTGNAKGQFNWMPQQVPAQPATIPASGGKFTFNWGKLGWINCDVFYSNPNPKTTVKVNLTNNPGILSTFRGTGNGNTFVFFVPKTINSTVQIYTHTTNSQVVSYTNSIPVGMEGVLLSYCIKDGQAWFVKKAVTITANMETSLTLEPSSTDAIQAELNSMNGL